MGTFQVDVEIGDAAGERWQRVSALADTGAAYTWIPGSILTRLEVKPSFRLQFVLADGHIVERDATETRMRLNGQVRTTIVVFGDEGSGSLLGAYPLEGFGLSVDPINRTLVPIERFSMAAGRFHRTELEDIREAACGRR